MAVIEATGGLRRHTVALCKALKHGKLLVPLSRALPGIEDEGHTTLQTDTLVHVHDLIKTETSESFAAVFTRKEILAPLEGRLHWNTDGGPLGYCAMPASVLFEMALKRIERGEVLSLVINPFHDSTLELHATEIRSFLEGKPMPLQLYLRGGSVVEQGEECYVGEPAVPPPAELAQAIESILSTRSDVEGYRLFQLFNVERDIEAHLALNIHTKASDPDRQQISSLVKRAIEGKVPPPGYIDILFNSAL